MRRLLPILLALVIAVLLGARPASSAQRTFGVYTDPSQLDAWASAVGARPQMLAKFESFSQARPLDDWLTQVTQQGISRVLVTWEPWKPVPTSLGNLQQSVPQPGYRNRDIVLGVQDSYIRRFARSLARFPGTVYLRYAHEMNGTWYPWSHDAANYRRAWRRVVRMVRGVGARNVRFVWSPNANMYETRARWLRNLRRYWPGAGYVDDVGTTVIDFGGSRRHFYTIDRFSTRFRILRQLYRKPLMLAETNTAYAGRVSWLRSLRRALRGMPWIRSVDWSQLTSRGQALIPGVGLLNWDVRQDPQSAAQLRGIIRDGEPASRRPSMVRQVNHPSSRL
jgi:mannan endo-1,4-beta-mannosidase